MHLGTPVRKRGDNSKSGGNIREVPISLASERGVSLVEVLIAAIILGIAVISVSHMFGTAGADVGKLGNQRVCLQLAQQEMERLLGLPYDDDELDTLGTHSRRFRFEFEGPPNDIGVPSLDGNLFVHWQVSYVDDPYGTSQEDYKLIVLELYYDLLDGDPHWQGSDPSGQLNDVERVITLTTLMAP